MVELKLLGGFELRAGDGARVHLESRKVEALLAYLVLNPEQNHPRAKLAGAFWPEMDESKARVNLRRALYVLRRALGEEADALRASASQVRLESSQRWRVDARRFERGIEAARRATDPRRRLERLAEAAALYRGPLLEGFYDDWALHEQERFLARYLEALGELADCHDRAGQYERALDCCQQALALQPGLERAHRQKMRALYRAGRQQEALQAYRACALTLQHLDAEPAPETRALHEQILKHELPSTARPAPGQLPQALTPFLGRQRELEGIRERLTGPSCRALTVTGPGGIGKTRLALEAAGGLAPAFPDGVFWIPLETVEDDDGAPLALLGALDAPPMPGGDPKRQLGDLVRDRRALLVLDNAERLAAGLGWLRGLLEAAPGVSLLATSREPLGWRGEWVVALEGLELPERGDPTPGERAAVALLLAAARRAAPDFAPDAQGLRDLIRICRLAQGVPLALELAAPWVRVMTPGEIADELEAGEGWLEARSSDLPARHRSLGAALAGSWKRLSAQERRALGRLAVFAGPFDRDAARAVANAPPSLLLGLLHKSLLRRTASGRFELLRVLRDAVRAKLERVPREAERAREAHAAHYASVLRARAEALGGADQARALRRIAADADNVRAGWRWAVERARADLVARYAPAWFDYLDLRGAYGEAEAAFRAAVERLDGAPAALRGTLLVRWGTCLERLARFAEAREALERGLALLEAEGTWDEVAFGLNGLGVVFDLQGDYDAAERCLERGLALCQARGDEAGAVRPLTNLGVLAWERGDFETATARYRESLALCRKGGDRRGVARALNNLGNVALARHDYPEARRYLTQSLAHYEKIDNPWGRVAVLNNLGSAHYGLGEYERAGAIHARCLARSRELGDEAGVVHAHKNLADVAVARGAHEEAAAQLRQALVRVAGLAFEPLTLEVLLGVAALWVETGQAEDARDLLARVLAHPATHQEARERAEALRARAGGPGDAPATGALDDWVTRALGALDA